jgi:hypothetical protein
VKAEVPPTAVSGGSALSVVIATGATRLRTAGGINLLSRSLYAASKLEGTSMKVLKSGEKVPASGIYRVLHSTPHLADQREMYFEGSRLPVCDLCPGGVLFRLESPCVPLAVPAVVELASAVS